MRRSEQDISKIVRAYTLHWWRIMASVK